MCAELGGGGQVKGGRTTFCEQKVAKKLCYAGPWALSATTPMAQHNKNFCAAFLKSGCFLLSEDML
jgi:hypothetical protein